MAAVRPTVSIIIPVHNEAHRLPRAIDEIRRFIAGFDMPCEVVIVENGSRDDTAAMAQRFAEDTPETIRAMSLPARGKGAAVRAGMLAATGAYRFMCDVDLSMPIDQIRRFLPPALPEVDVAIGSREHPDADVDDRAHRRFIGRRFNRMVRGLLPGIADTQCGFKCFAAPVAEAVFARQRLDGLAFDVEILVIARHLGYRIVEVPITWRADADSRVHLVRDAMAMARDLRRIRRHLRNGVYDDSAA